MRTTGEAGRELGVSVWLVGLACDRLGIAQRRYGTRRLLTDDEFALLRAEFCRTSHKRQQYRSTMHDRKEAGQ